MHFFAKENILQPVKMLKIIKSHRKANFLNLAYEKIIQKCKKMQVFKFNYGINITCHTLLMQHEKQIK